MVLLNVIVVHIVIYGMDVLSLVFRPEHYSVRSAMLCRFGLYNLS